MKYAPHIAISVGVFIGMEILATKWDYRGALADLLA